MKKLIWAIFVSLAIFNCGVAHADAITANITGDNNISYWNGSAWVGAGNNWQVADTFNFNVNNLSSLTYIAVSNDFTQAGSIYDGGNNPAGFLGSFTDNTGTFAATGTSTLLSNTVNFQVLAVSPWITNPVVYPNIADISTINPTVDPTTLSGWITPTSYGTNDSNGIWLPGNGAPISGIDPNAEWLWTANNSGSYATMDDYTIYEFNLGVTDGGIANGLVTPEPPTLLLFAFAAALFVLFTHRRRFI